MATPDGPGGLCVAGESLIDMLPRRLPGGEATFLPAPGGSPFNVLVGAKRLGAKAHYLATMSSDMFGDQLCDLLAKEEVNLDLVTRVENPSMLAFVKSTPGQGEKYAFFKENAAPCALTKQRVEEVFRTHRFDAVHMSLGAVTLEDSHMREVFEALFDESGRQGALRTFDPNLRGNMVKGGAAAYQVLFEAFLSRVDAVKCSDEDLAFMYGADASFRDVAQKWLGLGPKIVVFTRGGDGAVAFVPSTGSSVSEVSVDVPGSKPNTIGVDGSSLPVADTVGAGDTFMASLVLSIMGERVASGVHLPCSPLLDPLRSGAWSQEAMKDLRNAMQFAVVSAAINCSRAGCNPPTVDESMEAGRALGYEFAAPRGTK